MRVQLRRVRFSARFAPRRGAHLALRALYKFARNQSLTDTELLVFADATSERFSRIRKLKSGRSEEAATLEAPGKK